MDGDGSPDTSVTPISDKSLVMVTAVISLLIFSGVIAVYPHGLQLSPSVSLVYQGTDETFFAGKLNINGSINGTLTLHNITQILCPSVDEVRVVELMTLGYPADAPRQKTRSPMEEIVRWERW